MFRELALEEYMILRNVEGLEDECEIFIVVWEIGI